MKIGEGVRLAALVLAVIATLTLPLSLAKYATSGTGAAGTRVAKWAPKASTASFAGITATSHTILLRRGLIVGGSDGTFIWNRPLAVTVDNTDSETGARFRLHGRHTPTGVTYMYPGIALGVTFLADMAPQEGPKAVNFSALIIDSTHTWHSVNGNLGFYYRPVDIYYNAAQID